jgi:hypothetical protein
MRSSAILFCIILFLSTCKSKPGAETKSEPKLKLPAAPTSKETVKQLITDKDYIMFKAGFYDPESTDTLSPYEWINDSKDTSEFNKSFLEKEMTLEFIFNHDSTGVIFYDKQPSIDSSGVSIYIRKAANMTYQVDDSVIMGELPGIKLRVAEEQRNNFDGSMEKLVSTYFILGADETGILLEAPRFYVDKKAIVIMKAKEKK